MNMFYKKLIVFICYLFLVNNLCKSQELSISSNTLDLLNLGTINGEFGLSISKKWTLYIQSKLNPFNYSDKFQHKLFSIGTGAKYWFWYSNSGWFLSSQLSYISYNYRSEERRVGKEC